jgi:very-short-patch-repair endonuclease
MALKFKRQKPMGRYIGILVCGTAVDYEIDGGHTPNRRNMTGIVAA